MAWCCTPPAPPSGPTVEVVPMDFNKEDAIKAPASSPTSTKLGSQDSRARSDYTDRQDCDAPFDRYDGHSEDPCWGEVGKVKNWKPDDRVSGEYINNNADKEERLKQLLATFRPHVAKGIRLDVVDSTTQLFSQCMFKMDMTTHSIHLTYPFGDVQEFSLKEMSSIFKGQEFTRKLPKLAHLSSKCVGIEFESEYGSPLEPTCLHFEDTGSRNDFYACVRVMHMTSANVGPRQASGAEPR